MSAWLMTEQSLSNLANWFYFENDNHGTFKDCQKEIFKLFPKYKEEEFNENWDEHFSKELYKLNCYSLNQRYGDEDFKEFKYKKPKKISKIQALKSVQCWLYQSCEGDADKKPLYKLMLEIEQILLNAIVSHLEEYHKAKWE